jgi:hypothetical protein
LLRHDRLIDAEPALQILHARLAGVDEGFEQPDPRRVRQGAEKLRFQGLQARRRLLHFTSACVVLWIARARASASSTCAHMFSAPTWR